MLARLEPDLGTNRMFSEHEGSLSPDAYWRQKTWKRIVVIGAGPAVNAAIALILFTAVFLVGPGIVTRQIEHVNAGWPAAVAGLRAGDQIRTIAGHSVKPETLAKSINATKGRPFTMTVVRSGKRLAIGPLSARKDQGAYRIGITLHGRPGGGKPLPSLGLELAAPDEGDHHRHGVGARRPLPRAGDPPGLEHRRHRA